MTAPDAAEQLRALAGRVRRNVPRSGDPERFHIEASEIARGLIDIAEGLRPSTHAERTQGRMGDIRDDKTKTGPIPCIPTASGRRVALQQTRKPFAIHVENYE